MQLALQLPSFTLSSAALPVAQRLTEIAQLAEDMGDRALWVMDHFFQIPSVGDVTEPMLEGYTTLSYLAARTSRVCLGTLVTGVTYCQPGVLVKAVTTRDVLSGGRAWLGIGTGWNEQTLNHPQALSRPHPPILIGGSGERKTLRLVAKYADACNLVGRAGEGELRRKLEVLRRHCAAERRSYDAIEKTVLVRLDPAEASREPSKLIHQLTTLAAIGFQTAILQLRSMEDLRAFETASRAVLPQAAAA